MNDQSTLVTPLVQTEPSTPATVLVDQASSSMPVVTPEPLSLIQSVQDFLQLGGPVVWVLMAFSVIALAVVLLKLWQFICLQPENTADVEASLKYWEKGDLSQALAHLKISRPVSKLAFVGMSGLSGVYTDIGLLKEELSRIARSYLEQLRSYLRLLEVIGSLSPLLGLLGTVQGMILAFQRMEEAGSQVDPSVLSGGIWQALLTTAVGLIVAIPVVALHNWLERKAERVAGVMQDVTTRVFTLQAAEKMKAFEQSVAPEDLKRAA
jgi:biopolymer transport protein ExbB